MLALANYSDSESDSNSGDTKESQKKEENGKSVNSSGKKESITTAIKINKIDVPKDDIHCSDEEVTPEDIKLRMTNALINTSNRLGIQVQSSSEEESSSEESEVDNEETRPKTVYEVLDNPFRNIGADFTSGETVATKESVFQIAFREQENKKAAALERHVKMTAMAGAVQMINGKKMCWNHRKGRCRFGHNCTFAHDTDLQTEDVKRKKT